MNKYDGGCLCGKVRYKISSEPISQGICYCRQCRKTGGMFGSPLIVLRRNAFALTTALPFFMTTSDRGSSVRRYFCKHCGTQIFSDILDLPDIVTVKGATLDNYENFKPEYAVWTQDAPSIQNFSKDLPRFPGNAPIEIVLRNYLTALTIA